MARWHYQIVADLNAFAPVDGDWRRLDVLVAELWATGQQGQHTKDLLAVLERFPEGDGAGVLWSVLHGVESLPGYEQELIQSVQKRPSMLTVTMLGRLLNTGVSRVGTISLTKLLESIAADKTAPPSVRQSVAQWIQEHSEK